MPSYKAIAICILSGDLQLRRLGLQRIEGALGKMIEVEAKNALESDRQIDMFSVNH